VTAIAMPAGHLAATSAFDAGRVRRLVRDVPARAMWLIRHEARHLLLPLAVLTAISSLATVAAPGLRSQPLLLVALSPRLGFLTLAASKVGIVPFVAVGMVRLCIADPFHFVLGRRHASSTLERLTRHRVLARLSRIAGRSIPLLVFLRPNGTNLALAGASRSHAVQVAMADVVGTFAYLVVVHQVGASLF